MTANQQERLKRNLPVISKRLAGKTRPIVVKMKKLKLIKDSDFPNDVNPPNRILEILAESGNSAMIECLIITLKMEGLQDLVREIEGQNSQTEDFTETSDSFHENLEHKLQTEDSIQVSDRINVESLCRNVEKMNKDINQRLGQISEELREYKEEARRRDKQLLEMITKIESEKDEMKQSLEKKEAAYESLEQQFKNLERKYNRLVEEMSKKETTEQALIEKNRLLDKEIHDMRQKLINMKKSTTERGKEYSNQISPRRVQRK